LSNLNNLIQLFYSKGNINNNIKRFSSLLYITTIITKNNINILIVIGLFEFCYNSNILFNSYTITYIERGLYNYIYNIRRLLLRYILDLIYRILDLIREGL
jgi:hypothetical protein